MRTDTEEGTVLWINLPNVGVVTSLKRDFFLQLITGMMASRPSNSICVVLHANRASESKRKPAPQGFKIQTVLSTSSEECRRQTSLCFIYLLSAKNAYPHSKAGER